MKIGIIPHSNLNIKTYSGSKRNISTSNYSVNFTGIMDFFKRNTVKQTLEEKLTNEAEKRARVEFKKLKSLSRKLGLKIDKNDNATTLERKIAQAQQDDEYIGSTGVQDLYFSHSLGRFTEDPFERALAENFDKIP